ncbi:TolC family type I secretion outer membrane protein [Leminorella grimontii]|uniref:TolC family type I secretion outer membrane protein n=1 Tax=Leminorella grimontii TaxID=82981 RepID=A0AAV5N2P4_9GAMM|nr:TolC family outer membrane protein [Leminorella grimontii]GKX56391.1 TolC family type I secretion outer membrane protein [Leminorella grimontii]VFS60662.1 Outer membrane efflux protein BepC precursor [Leminorella grimontii]
MEKLRPLGRWLTGCLCVASLHTGAREQNVSAERLMQQQELPSLNGRAALTQAAMAPTSLKLEQAVNRAVSWHPSIQEAVSRLYQQSEQVDVALAKYYPQIEGGVNGGYTNSYSDSGFSPSLSLSLSQMLYDFGKVDSQVRAERAGVAQEQANLLVAIDDVVRDTAMAIVQVQTWQQMVETAQAQLAALTDIGRLTQQRHSEGAATLSDVVQTESRIEGARAQLTQYQASLDSARATLMAYLGWDSLNEVDNGFSDAFSRACDSAEPDYRQVPSVLAAWAQANVAQARLDNANAQMTPTVSLEPEVRHYLNDRYVNSETLDRTQYSAWVKVSMPIYQGGGLTASRNAAGHAVEAARAAVQRARLDARQKLTDAYSQSLNLTNTLQTLTRQQALTERTRDLYQEQYLNLGNRPLLDVLNAQQEVFQSRFSLQQTRSQLHQLRLQCLYYTGKLRNAFKLENRNIQSVEIRP